MAWVKYKDSDGLVLGVYATETAAAPGAGESREEVDPLPDTLIPGQFRHSDGSYSDQPPDSATADSVKQSQRRQIHEAFLEWRQAGRSEYWVSLRGDTNPRYPIEATDRWAHHIVALVDQVIEGAVFSTKSAAEIQDFVDHADNILRTMGPTWYEVMVSAFDASSGDAYAAAENYRSMGVVAGSSLIYTDICTSAGVTRTVDGTYNGMPTTIASGFNPESATLGR